MKDKSSNTNQGNSTAENILPGYPEYSACDDIYNQYTEEKDIDPEDTSAKKAPVEVNIVDPNKQKKLSNPEYFSNLDVPGSELDDIQENIGSEDEENNYYSLGGDDHNDLEEDQSE